MQRKPLQWDHRAKANQAEQQRKARANLPAPKICFPQLDKKGFEIK